MRLARSRLPFHHANESWLNAAQRPTVAGPLLSFRLEHATERFAEQLDSRSCSLSGRKELESFALPWARRGAQRIAPTAERRLV